jgi:hypothetical protein
MSTITEDYVSFEIAKLLRNKGFSQDPNICNTAYTTKGKFSNNAKSFAFNYELIKPRSYYTAPTIQMAMKWLREVHNVNIEIHYNRFGENYKYLIIYKPEVLDDIRSLGVFYSYEEACEAAINYCLENLI